MLIITYYTLSCTVLGYLPYPALQSHCHQFHGSHIHSPNWVNKSARPKLVCWSCSMKTYLLEAAKEAMRVATAATRAAPRPLPSSDNIKSNCWVMDVKLLPQLLYIIHVIQNLLIPVLSKSVCIVMISITHS